MNDIFRWLGAISLLVWAGSCQANLLTNGSFENTNSTFVPDANKVDELLKFVPSKCYPDCTPSEKARFDEFKVALEKHRVAVRQARSAVTKAVLY